MLQNELSSDAPWWNCMMDWNKDISSPSTLAQQCIFKQGTVLLYLFLFLSCSPVQNLYLFLAQPNCLVHLDLSGTDCTVDSVCTHCLCTSHHPPICVRSHFWDGSRAKKQKGVASWIRMAHRTQTLLPQLTRSFSPSSSLHEAWVKAIRSLYSTNVYLLMNYTNDPLYEEHAGAFVSCMYSHLCHFKETNLSVLSLCLNLNCVCRCDKTVSCCISWKDDRAFSVKVLSGHVSTRLPLLVTAETALLPASPRKAPSSEVTAVLGRLSAPVSPWKMYSFVKSAGWSGGRVYCLCLLRCQLRGERTVQGCLQQT